MAIRIQSARFGKVTVSRFSFTAPPERREPGHVDEADGAIEVVLLGARRHAVVLQLLEEYFEDGMIEW